MVRPGPFAYAGSPKAHMVDNLSIAISHILLALMLWRLYHSATLDHDQGQEKRGFLKYKSKPIGDGNTPGA